MEDVGYGESPENGLFRNGAVYLKSIILIRRSGGFGKSSLVEGGVAGIEPVKRVPVSTKKIGLRMTRETSLEIRYKVQ